MFGKKKKEEEKDSEESEEEEPEEKPEAAADTGDVSLGKMSADLEKLKARFNTFFELNNASTERFTRINEQIGEVRSMILERDKESKMLEGKATQAIDLVSSVQPDKLMIEVRKQDAKLEAFRANIESNEIMLKNATSEIKDMRNKMRVFTGMEQVISMSEEVKGELSEIRKLGATVTRQGDKVETIFTEMQKRFGHYDRYLDSLKDNEKAVKDMAIDLDGMKTKLGNLASKKDVEDLLAKFGHFEKNVSNLVSIANKKIETVEKELNRQFDDRIEKVDKLVKGFELLAQRVPDLDKYFNLLDEEAKKAPKDYSKVERLAVPGQEPAPEKKEEKKSLFSKLKDKVMKKE